MSGFPWIVLAAIVAILAVAGMLLAYMIRKKGRGRVEQATNYRVFFMMGIAMVPIGAALIIASFFLDLAFGIGVPLLAMGVVYISLGLANRDKWKKKERVLPPARFPGCSG